MTKSNLNFQLGKNGVSKGLTSLMRAAPAFSMGSGSSIARAIVTPSLTTFGLPNSSKTTFLPAIFTKQTWH